VYLFVIGFHLEVSWWACYHTSYFYRQWDVFC